MRYFKFLILACAVSLASTADGASRAASFGLAGEHLDIALRVAGDGLPDCRSYLADGRVQPCLPAFTVKRSNSVNGWSQGGRITFTQGAIQKLTREEFAILAGHEIAHWYLGHKGSSPQAELDADRLGLALACRAGFNIGAGLGLFRYIRTNSSHGRTNLRMKAVYSAQCEQLTKPATLPTIQMIEKCASKTAFEPLRQ